MKIYCAIKLGENEKVYLKRIVDPERIQFRDELKKEDRHSAFMNADICFGNVRPEWLEETTKLKWIQLQSVGFGVYQNLRPKVEFKMTHLKNFFGVPVAETALAGILTLYRGTDQCVRDQEKRQWQGIKMRPGLRLVSGKKVMIVGGGSIGQHLKKCLEGFGAETTIYGRRPVNSDIQSPEALDKRLSQMDIIVSSLPGTSETIHFFDRRRLELFKKDALFVNVGRGSAVEEEVLIERLNNRDLWGAVLDVTREEPLPEDHPLYECPNTLLTQHTAGGYQDEILDIVKVFVGNLDRFEKGQELEHLVNLGRGY